MPITPLHFGPGLAIKAIVPKNFSFTLFAFTQIVIDLESVYFFLQDDLRTHRFFHGYVGATIVLIVSIVIGKPLCQWLFNKWNGKLSKGQKKWLYIESKISMKSAIIGSIFGAYIHVFLDSIMHIDIKPFSPFTDTNMMYRLMTLNQLDLFCLISGILGVLVFIICSVKKRIYQ